MLVAEQLLIEPAQADAEIVLLRERRRRAADARQLLGGRASVRVGETPAANQRTSVIALRPTLRLRRHLIDTQALQIRRELLVIPGRRRVRRYEVDEPEIVARVHRRRAEVEHSRNENDAVEGDAA